MASRLVNQQSAYLRSAKDQPVDWYPWGPKPFERAKAEHKPVLLDIGAVWCHWCHVMDHESYEDPELAEILNRDWICIKVDRDERPDVDARYQRAVQSLTGQGGWPLTAFLTGDGEVFYGGTYFPPTGMGGRPGFRELLSALARVFLEKPEQVSAQAAEITRRLTAAREAPERGRLSSDILAAGVDAMSRMFDRRNGGFGSQPKFPHPGACEFVLSRWFDTREPWLLEVVHRTLEGMGRGGMRDHLGGGFHRYSVDAQWIVPHFEKMLYDNAELLRVYVHAAAVSGGLVTSGAGGPDSKAASPGRGDAALYHEIIDGILGWIDSTMADADGGYFASQDADVTPGDDGDYFTWTPDEVRAVTQPDEFEVLCHYYDIRERGEMHHNPRKNVLWTRGSVEQTASALGLESPVAEALLVSGRSRLREARCARATPFVDRTIYSAWNAMMASAVLEAAALLARPDLEQQALAALERLFRGGAAHDLEGGIRRAVGSAVAGILEDQVHVAHAAVDAFEATGQRQWLDRAAGLMHLVWDHFRRERGGLLDTRRGRGGEGFLTQEVVPIEDAPIPSSNGLAGIVLSRLAELSGDPSWASKRDELLESFADGAERLSIFGATLMRAFDWALMPVTHIVVVGADDSRTHQLLWTARAVYRPRKAIRWIRPGDPPDRLPEPVRAMLDGSAPRAYVCVGMQCAAPVDAPAELAAILTSLDEHVTGG